MSDTPEVIVDAFKKVAAELCEAKQKVAVLESRLRIANFPTTQATECGRCHEYKHTPWRDDESGYGYVCATCLVEINNEQIEIIRSFLTEDSRAKAQESIEMWRLRGE